LQEDLSNLQQSSSLLGHAPHIVPQSCTSCEPKHRGLLLPVISLTQGRDKHRTGDAQ